MIKRILALSGIGVGLMLGSGPQATAQQTAGNNANWTPPNGCAC